MDTERLDRRLMIFGIVATRQQAAVDGGVQRLDAAIEDLGKSGYVADADDVEPILRRWASVPPVETSSKPSSARPLANDSKPFLSYTLNTARRGCRPPLISQPIPLNPDIVGGWN